jgi:hypothetical protein
MSTFVEKTLDGGIVLNKRRNGRIEIYTVQYGNEIREVTSDDVSLQEPQLDFKLIKIKIK